MEKGLKAKITRLYFPACQQCGHDMKGVYKPDRIRFCSDTCAVDWYRDNDPDKLVVKEH